MAIQFQRVPVEEFDQFIELPHNADKFFEYIGGEIVEAPSNPYVSMIAARIITFFGLYLMNNDIGHVTGEAGGYMVSGERYAPDVAFIAKARQPHLARKGYNPNPPDLAVEVISDADSSEEQTRLRVKVTNYLAAGVTVWVVNADLPLAEVHRPGLPVQIVEQGGKLDGGDILPGFELWLAAIFPAES